MEKTFHKITHHAKDIELKDQWVTLFSNISKVV